LKVENARQLPNFYSKGFNHRGIYFWGFYSHFSFTDKFRGKRSSLHLLVHLDVCLFSHYLNSNVRKRKAAPIQPIHGKFSININISASLGLLNAVGRTHQIQFSFIVVHPFVRFLRFSTFVVVRFHVVCGFGFNEDKKIKREFQSDGSRAKR
jgi:hypothetical protein